MEEKPVKKNSQLKSQARREFIKKSTLVGAGVAATSMASTAAIADLDDSPPKQPEQKGYQLTQHVLDYYKSAGV